MESRDQQNQLQCVVDEGLIVNRRDMSRILGDVGQVRYQELFAGAIRRQGEGIIVHVAASDHAATVIVNKRLYLNVNAFDCLRLSCDEAGGAIIDLVMDARTLRLIPVSDPISDRSQAVAIDPIPAARSPLDRLFGSSFAEVYLDDGDEDGEED